MTNPETSWPLACGLRYSSSNTIGPCLRNGPAGKGVRYQTWQPESVLWECLGNQRTPTSWPLTSVCPCGTYHAPQNIKNWLQIKYYFSLKETRATSSPDLTDSKSKQETSWNGGNISSQAKEKKETQAGSGTTSRTLGWANVNGVSTNKAGHRHDRTTS